MNFEEAIKLLRQGRLVRREQWTNYHHHIGFDCWENILMMCYVGRHREGNIMFLPYEMTLEDLNSDDWEEVQGGKVKK